MEGLRMKEDQTHLTKGPPEYNQWGGALNRGQGRGRGPYTPRPLYCMYHDNETNHRTPHLHRHQMENGPRIHSTFATTTLQGGQPHHAMGSAQQATLRILPSTLSNPNIAK
jgi:hypothetical protein